MKKLTLALALFGASLFGQTATYTVTIKITDTINPPIVQYNIYRSDGPCLDFNTIWVKRVTLPVKTYTWQDTEVAPGTYCYAATAQWPLNADPAYPPPDNGESAKSNLLQVVPGMTWTLAAPGIAATVVKN